VVFDADMAAKRHFFMKVLEVMWDEETALCLTPQVRFFHNVFLPWLSLHSKASKVVCFGVPGADCGV
jgi:hypothetical protein